MSLMELAACSRLTSADLVGEFEIFKHWLNQSYANFSTWQLFLDLTPHYSHSKFSSNLPTFKCERPGSASFARVRRPVSSHMLGCSGASIFGPHRNATGQSTKPA
jgi:hypothetical protein